MTTCKSQQAEEHFSETLKVLGSFWALRIIYVLKGGSLRFCEIERALGNSNPTTLTRYLKKLEDSGYIARDSSGGYDNRQSVSYELLEKGQLVIPVIEAIKSISQKTEQDING